MFHDVDRSLETSKNIFPDNLAIDCITAQIHHEDIQQRVGTIHLHIIAAASRSRDTEQLTENPGNVGPIREIFAIKRSSRWNSSAGPRKHAKTDKSCACQVCSRASSRISVHEDGTSLRTIPSPPLPLIREFPNGEHRLIIPLREGTFRRQSCLRFSSVDLIRRKLTLPFARFRNE